MQTIKILDPQEAIKIAAGEVVERPAHILKELIENSIDAGATSITINTQQAGKKLLSITDNGCGMSEQDAQLCFAHHATSKITYVSDLESVATYGFRGEALSSIVAVSHVTITTKKSDAKSATQIILEHGKLLEQKSAAHPTGTTISVTDLFANIPARKKFLKSNDTEWNALVNIFQAFCLRYPKIHFKLLHDDKLSYNCPATNDTAQRCAQLWSNNLFDHLINIETTNKNSIEIFGAISSSHYHRYNRNQIFTFVNNRWVKNIELSRAIIKGYQNVLPPKKYPAAFIFITLDQANVDINIHPKKEEVKFLHPGIVQKTIQDIVTKTLNKSINKTFEQRNSADLLIKHEDKKNTTTINNTNAFAQPHTQALSHVFDTNVNSSSQVQQKNDEENRTTPISKTSVTENIIESDPFNTTLNSTTDIPNIVSPHKSSLSSVSASSSPTERSIQKNESNQTIYKEIPFTIIGQFATTYIIIEKEKELIVIDQHAAHERILYENYKKNFTQAATVQLLFPHIIKLNKQDIQTLGKHLDVFRKHGIVCEEFSETELIIQATPVSLQHKALDDIIGQTLQWIKEHEFVDSQEFFKELNEQLHAQKACKTAHKAGDTLNNEQMNNIVKTLLTIENRFCCPHGRPTMWHMTLKDLEKYFHRDYRSKRNNTEEL